VQLMKTADDVTGPVNIGNPEEFTILQLAEMVIELTGTWARIVHRPRPTDDPMQRRPDISRAQNQLGWQPQTPLREGLGRTIAYFEELLTERGVREALTANSTA